VVDAPAVRADVPCHVVVAESDEIPTSPEALVVFKIHGSIEPTKDDYVVRAVQR
jgi:hypothetical protein